jgi:hypothetical protein
MAAPESNPGHDTRDHVHRLHLVGQRQLYSRDPYWEAVPLCHTQPFEGMQLTTYQPHVTCPECIAGVLAITD